MTDGMIGLVTWLGLLLLNMGCTPAGDQPTRESWETHDTTYVFTEPDAEFRLDADLEEISGLTFLEDGMIGAVQDEDGELFIIDPSTGDVVDVRKFGGKGDYEGIELANDRLYVLRSDGRVFTFDRWAADAIEGESHDHDLPRRCDAEGVAYQWSLERILIACKENGGKAYEGKKVIFAFDPATNALDPSPAYVMDIADFEFNVEDHPLNEAVRAVLSERMDMSGFKPSGLAVHPRTGDVYVVSSVTKAVLRLNEAGAVTALWVLPGALFDQPEGIAFDANGDLFISNEAGDRKRATLLRFRERRVSPAIDSDQTVD